MAIRASYQFEKTFYEKCKEGPLSADEIEIIYNCTKEAWKCFK